MIENELTEQERKLLAFALFGLGMRIGPSSFRELELIVQKLEVEKEFAAYASSWIDYAEKLKKDAGN
jgi:hypothetical protein